MCFLDDAVPGSVAFTLCNVSQLSEDKFHTEWRRQAAILIASELDMELFGVKGVYLFGSVESGEAGPGSDIDLIFHICSSENQKRAMRKWLDTWNSRLCDIFKRITGTNISYMLDIHLVDDTDMERKTCFAYKIQSIMEPAEPLRIMR